MDNGGGQNTRTRPGAKTRSHKGYSHNGCSRCKSQRTRCDEKKPSCGRCDRAGVKCPGYGQQFRWSTKYEVFRPEATKRTRPAVTKTTPVAQRSDVASATSEPSVTHEIRLDEPVESPPVSNEVQNRGNEYPEETFDNVLSELPGFGDYSDFSELFAHSQPLELLGTPFPFSDLGHSPLNMTGERITEEKPGDPLPPHTQSLEVLDPPTTAFDASDFSIVPPSPSRNIRDSGSKGITNPQSAIIANRGRLVVPTKSLNDPALVLVEFYFKETAQLFSCYDSSMNPFRTTVSRIWKSSPLIYRTLQSMAAASLVEDFPQLGALGRKMRKEAIELLNTNTSSDSDTLLAMLMLGGSASWHDTSDLGLSFFNAVRKRLAAVPAGTIDQLGVDYQFFHQSMTYWEMLLSYVAENDDLHASDKSSVTDGCLPVGFIPHPWTGFARDTQHAVQKVGRLIRRQRKIAFSRRFTSLAHIKQLEKDMATASELEEYLSGLSHPLETTVIDPDDRNTPVWHLLSLAEAYRSTGLIQLYHIFPDLLDRRLARDGIWHASTDFDDASEGLSVDAKRRNEWLTAYALEVLKLMKSIPLESGTRDFQPFILVSLSSELRLPSTATNFSDDAAPNADVVEHLESLSSQTIEVSRMRHFIKSRLTSFLHILPPKPIRVCLDIVETTWKLMDERAALAAVPDQGRRGSYSDTEEVYWMDVMIENGWETTMA